MPHRAVIKEGAETTKLRVVYDCSARAREGAPSLNDCLDPGPALQNKLWNVLVRGRFHPVAVAGDVRKAFLQVRVREEERDELRFHWLRDINSTEVQTLRFTRVLFGLAPSPFLLGGVIEQHLKSWRDRLPESVEEILPSLYVDDLISGGPTVSEASGLKRNASTIFADAGFTLHKWHSNEPELESVPTDQNPADLGSRGGTVNSALWWDGPEWLPNRDAWPLNPVTVTSSESKAESKVIRETLAAATVEDEVDEFDQLLDRHDLRRTLRVCAWVARFARNCRKTARVVGSLTAAELEEKTAWWIRRVQVRAMETPKFVGDQLQLNLQSNERGMLECRGRIQGHYPIYLPGNAQFTEKFVQRAHHRATSQETS